MFYNDFTMFKKYYRPVVFLKRRLKNTTGRFPAGSRPVVFFKRRLRRRKCRP